MSIAAEKMAEILALPRDDRAFLAKTLLVSLDAASDEGAESEWRATIERRALEIESGKTTCRPVEEVIQDIRQQLHARRQPS